MKRILTIFVAILGFTGMANAQTTETGTGNTKATETTSASAATGESSCYCCPKGDFCSTQAGTCALHTNIKLVKDGEYFCPMEDNVSGSSTGSCPVSGKAMVQMDGKCTSGAGFIEGEAKGKKSNKKSKGDEQTKEQNNSGEVNATATGK